MNRLIVRLEVVAVVVAVLEAVVTVTAVVFCYCNYLLSTRI